MKKLLAWWRTPRSSYQLHFVLSIFWCLMAIPTVLFWHGSVAYLVFISVYTVIGFHVMALKESRLEAMQEEVPRFRYKPKMVIHCRHEHIGSTAGRRRSRR